MCLTEWFVRINNKIILITKHQVYGPGLKKKCWKGNLLNDGFFLFSVSNEVYWKICIFLLGFSLKKKKKVKINSLLVKINSLLVKI